MIRFVMIFALLAAGSTSAQEAEAPLGPPGLDTLPPLSLADAVNLTNRAQLLLEGYGGSGASQEDLRLARLMLQCVIDFAQLHDQRSRSLIEYDFVYLGKMTLETMDEEIEQTLVASAPVPNVQAIAMRSTREIVEVKSIIVSATDDVTFTLRPEMILDPDIPGRSFDYLPERVTVTRVTVTAMATTWDQGRPRLKIWLGQTPRPEHLRQGLYHLRAASDALYEGNADRAGAELDLARQRLAGALEAEGV